MARTRTNIEIENDYVDVIIKRFGVRTKTDAIDLALRHLAGDPMSREEALAMRGTHAIDALPAEQSALRRLHQDRELTHVAAVVGLRLHPASLEQ